MPHNKRHIGSANQDATTYGMPRREAIARGRQHMSLMSKSMEKNKQVRKQFEQNPSLKNLNKLRKQGKKTAAISKSGGKIAKRLAETRPRRLGSQKGYN